jgi:hypothetical protein
MAYRFLTLLLFGVLALAAFDGFEERRESRDPADQSATTVTTEAPSEAAAMHDGNPWPPPKL